MPALRKNTALQAMKPVRMNCRFNCAHRVKFNLFLRHGATAADYQVCAQSGNTLPAALNRNRKLGFTTFMNDPQLSFISPEAGQKMFDDMLKNQREWFPESRFL